MQAGEAFLDSCSHLHSYAENGSVGWGPTERGA